MCDRERRPGWRFQTLPFAAMDESTAATHRLSSGGSHPHHTPSGVWRRDVGRVFRFGGTHLRALRQPKGSRRVETVDLAAREFARTQTDRATSAFRGARRPERAVGTVVHVEAGVWIRARRSVAGSVKNRPPRWVGAREVRHRWAQRRFRLPVQTKVRMLRGDFGRRVGSSDRVVSLRRVLRCGS